MMAHTVKREFKLNMKSTITEHAHELTGDHASSRVSHELTGVTWAQVEHTR